MLINCVKFFSDTSEAFPKPRVPGTLWCYCDNKNSKEQEATGSLQKELTTVQSRWPTAQASCALDGFLSVAPPCSPFPVFSESLPIPVVIAPRVLSQVVNIKRYRHLDSKQLGGGDGWLGEDRRHDISLSLSAEGHSLALC